MIKLPPPGQSGGVNLGGSKKIVLPSLSSRMVTPQTPTPTKREFSGLYNTSITPRTAGTETLPQTTQALKDLGYTLMHPGDVNRESGSLGKNIINSFKTAGQNFITKAKDVLTNKDKSLSGQYGKDLSLVAATGGLVFSPITALFTAANEVPVLNVASKLITVPFTALGEVATTATNDIVDKLPISKEAKAKIKPGLGEVAALAAQLALGKYVDPIAQVSKLSKRFGKTDAQTIVDQGQKLGDIKRIEVIKGAEIPPEIQYPEGAAKYASSRPTLGSGEVKLLPEGMSKPTGDGFTIKDKASKAEIATAKLYSDYNKARNDLIQRPTPSALTRYNNAVQAIRDSLPVETPAKIILPPPEQGLLAPKTAPGEAIVPKVGDTLSSPEIGKIEVIQGDNNFGLSKIQNSHPEVMPVLSEAIKSAKVVDTLPNMTILEGKTPKGVVRMVVDHQLGTGDGIVPKTFLSNAYFKDVPRSGVEPLTQGSSNLRSTGELTGPRQNIPQDLLTSKPTKTSGLASGVEAKAVEAKLTKGFEGLSEYETINIKEQTQLAQDLIKNDSALAKKIAMGDEPAPGNLRPFSVYTALEEIARKQGDVATLRDLATGSKLNAESSGAAQTLRLLAERDPESPVSAMKDIADTRQKNAKIKDVSKAKKDVVTEIKKNIPKIPKETWSSFVDSLVC